MSLNLLHIALMGLVAPLDPLSIATDGFLQSESAATFPTFAGSAYRQRKGYIIRGKRYWLTEEELAILVAQMLMEISRSDVKEVTAGKPKTISKRIWNTIRPLERLEALLPVEDDDEDETMMMFV